MKKLIIFIVIFTSVSIYFIKDHQIEKNIYVSNISSNYLITAKRDLLCLFMAYPEHVIDVAQINGDIYIIMKSGNKILYDDKKLKSAEVKLNYPDLQDMLEETYPLTDIDRLMDKDCNPGRIRHYKLLNEVYGTSKSQISSNIITVKGGYNNFQFNKQNNASYKLSLAMNEITNLINTNPKIGNYVYPTGGTFNYRMIADTNRLSPHAFGIAIDLVSNKNDYWKWTSKDAGEKRLLSYPKEIVHTFEKNNFIWGGKWYYFDILHFEYRPELIIKSRYFPNAPTNYELWFDGAPINEVQRYINLIDSKIK